MKTLPVVVISLILCATSAVLPRVEGAEPSRQSSNHRVVFELTSADKETWSAVLNNIENLRQAFGAESADVLLVVHGKAIGFLKSTNAEQSERMQKLAAAGVVFAACENTMKRQSVKRDELLKFATTVDAGVAEIVRKQEAGWSYIRSGG